MSLHYVKGDATNPTGRGDKIIVHCCNDIGAWGAGFVMALSRRWPQPEQKYREWFDTDHPPKLGAVQFVRVNGKVGKLYVANLIGQRGLRSRTNPRPVKYDAIARGLEEVSRYAFDHLVASIHMPRMGCGLAGGSWTEVEPIIRRTLHGHSVYVYDYEEGQ